MKHWRVAIGIAVSAVAVTANAGDGLCRVNPYTRAEATQGKVLFDSHCALCHQYSMVGREPGNFRNESPDINLLSESDVKFLDGGGGVVPPLIGAKFMTRQKGKSLAEFTSTVSGAANSFPPTGQVDMPMTYLKIAAYVLYRNCGKL
jgi:mono/diheme cytochrome c family protein